MSTQNDIMIQAEDLTKVYGNYTAIDSINFTCKRGEIVGFLGPNGAGKTTTMRILTGYMPPTSGAAYIAGYHTLNDSVSARQRLGYLPETVPLYPEMSVEGYLAFIGRMRRVDRLWERVDDVLETVDLLDRAESLISSLSKGMRQRVGLAQAMLHDPDVLILDEPTIGLDPRQVVDIRRTIKELGKRHTILLSTHILSEVEQLCDRVIMVFNGKIWSDMPMSQLTGEGLATTLNVTVARPDEDASELLASVEGVSDVQALGEGRYRLRSDGNVATRGLVADTVMSGGWGLLELASERISLEATFLANMREAEKLPTEMEGSELNAELADSASAGSLETAGAAGSPAYAASETTSEEEE